MATRKMKAIRAQLLLALVFEFAVSGHAQIFVAGFSPIGTYSTTGAPLNPSLVPSSVAHGLALDGNGNLFAATTGRGSYPFFDVYKYTVSGVPASGFHIQTTDQLLALAADGMGNLFVANASRGTIMLYDSSGVLLNPNLISGLSDPRGIALDGNGSLFVANYGNGTIGEYSTQGAAINPALVSGLNGPERLALSGDGHIFVASYPSPLPGNISEYTFSGATVSASIIPVANATDVAFAPNGDLLVLSYDGRVGEYTTLGGTVNASLISGLSFPLAMVVAVPEPSLFALVGLGFLFLYHSLRDRP